MSQRAIGSLRGEGEKGERGGEAYPVPRCLAMREILISKASSSCCRCLIARIQILSQKKRREGSYSSNKGMPEDTRMDVNRAEPCHSLLASKSILFASPASHLTLSLTKHAYAPSVLAQLIQGEGERRDVQTQNDILHRSHGNADRWGWESSARWMDIVFPLSGVTMLVPYFGP
jgi:hypothetical protein